MKKNSSIINQTVYKVSILFLFAFIIMTIAISQLFLRTMQARIVEDQQLIVSQNVERVNVTFEGLIRPIITLASSQSCVKLLNDYNELYSVEWMKNIREMDEFLENVLLFHDFILDVTLIQTDSNVVYSRKDLMRKDFDYVNAEWFEKAMSIDGLLKYALPDNKEYYYNEIGKNYATTIIYPVKNKEIIRGYILFEIDLTRVSPLFKEGNSDGYTGYLTVSHDGKIISDYRRSRKNAKVISEDLYEYTISKTQKPKLIDNNLYISNVLSSTDWYIISETDMEVMTKPVKDFMKILLYVILFTLIALSLIVFQLSKRLKGPFDQLIKRITSYDGSLSQEVINYEKAPIEIEVIGHRFDDMTKKIDNLIKDVYLARMHQQEMELLALTNQINPHFLYNVLQLIQTKAVIARNSEIEEMIIALGQMLRYTMERTGERVKIQDEMNYIQNYLKFYKARFDSLFDYEIIYDPDILSKTMLKFIIQPIVENCFKHGFKNKKEGGVIRIKIYEEGTDIVFDVYDNGDGISDERIKKIYEGLDNHTNRAGIGIQNTNLRLKLVYGNNYGIHISSQIGEFTQVIARIKAEENQEVHNV